MAREAEQGAGQSAAGEPRSGNASLEAISLQVEAVLSRAPAVYIPPDFAARVAGRAVAQRQTVRSRWQGFGVRIALGSAVLLPIALFAFAPHAQPSVLDLRFDMEMALLLELGGVGYLLTRAGLRD